MILVKRRMRTIFRIDIILSISVVKKDGSEDPWDPPPPIDEVALYGRLEEAAAALLPKIRWWPAS
jgi:hypothetical protein